MIDLIKLEGCICYSRMYLNYCIFFMKRPQVTSFPLSLLITDTGFVTRLTRRVPLVKQEMANPSGAPEFTPVFSGVRVTRS
jgi:hypothetical protein